MFKHIKRLGALSLTVPMVLLAGCGNSNTSSQTVSEATKEETKQQQSAKEDTNKEVVTIRMGTHYAPAIDPRYKDPITGESGMSPEQLRAAEAALEVVMDELNVDFQIVQYPGNTTEVLLQSVMAGDPICEIAWMWNGSQSVVLAQNVLQPLSQYASIFEEDEEANYMLFDEVFGDKYFFSHEIMSVPQWPLIYNIDYIEAVDALKEDGKTVYPTDLYNRGEWTWSKFEEYLTKIDAHYSNSQSPNRPERRIKAFETDYRFTALHAIYSNGGGVYGKDGLMVATDETKQAVAYLNNLFDKKLMWAETWGPDNSEPGWTWNCGNFANGETVFTNQAQWMIKGASDEAAKRGQSIGIIPFPRPDGQAMDNDSYSILQQAADCAGVLKGVSPEKTELALEAYKLYWTTFYKELAGSDKVADYLGNSIEDLSVEFGLDIFHPEIGDDMLEIYRDMLLSIRINDYTELVGIATPFNNLFCDSMTGLNGVPKYDVAIEANKNVFEEKINSMQQILKSGEIRDNIAPFFNTTQVGAFAFPVGTDLSTINWSDYLTAEDNIDGPLDMAKAIFEVTADSAKVGVYNDALTAKIKDNSDNEGSKKYQIVIYDEANTTAPEVVAKKEYRTLKIDEDTANIAWANDFIETATDKDGIDIKSSITADLSQLDTTTAGKYSVELTATDYAGNITQVVVEVEVVAE